MPQATIPGMRRREFLTGSALVSMAAACRRSEAPVTPKPSSEPQPTTPTAGPAAERVLEEGHSAFNHVVVTQQGSVRKLYFQTNDVWLLQSTYDLDAPLSLHHEVFQTMVSGLLLQPAPKRMCMIGLGGGQLSNYLHHHLPELELDVVEICPAVVRLARAWFGVPEADPRYRVHIGDGRVFVESLPDASVDLIVHDAYRGHSIPQHLRSQEFFAACAAKLRPGGIVVANMHRRVARYPIDRATMASVFRHVYRFASADDIQTSVVMSMDEQARTPAQLHETARALQHDFDFDLISLAQRCEIDESGWDATAIVHDDFDPEQLDEAARRHNLSCTPRCTGD